MRPGAMLLKRMRGPSSFARSRSLDEARATDFGISAEEQRSNVSQGIPLGHVAALLLGRNSEVCGPRLVERARPGGVDAPRRHAVEAYAWAELFRQALDERRHPRAQHVRGVEVLYR